MISDENSPGHPEKPTAVEDMESGAALGGWERLSAFSGRLAELLFAVLIILMLTTPSWRGGTFTWLPLAKLSDLGGVPASLGILTLLPFAIAAAWAVDLFARWRSGVELNWTWGRFGVTVPLLVFTFLGLVSLWQASPRNVFIQLGGLLIFWALYLFVLNQRPNVVWPLVIVVLVQAASALGQFATRSDLGLLKLGEFVLDPEQPGIVVLFARGQRWLRAYGLTSHPNLLGAMLAAVLLLLLPTLKRSRGRARVVLVFVFAAGVLGLLASFSRAAILGFIAGLVTWLFLEARQGSTPWSLARLKKTLRSPWLWLGIAGAVVVLVLFGDLAFSRLLGLDSNVESISLIQRFFDWRLALTLIVEQPIRGVGLGQYIIAAQRLSPFAVTVHNVPLLVTAELGIGGFLALLWLTISGLRSRPAGLGPWIAVLVIGFFDVTLWLTGNWQTAVLFSLIAANLSQKIIGRTMLKPR
ncbi:MAG: O-antigen ligase family protein [Chloroflexota bacterium]|nr:MAG: O-antigen ligase family protein [Chloroflexota bacterium]